MPDLKTTYDRIAKDWTLDHNDDTWWIKGTDEYLSFFEPDAVVLDVGCGAGEKSAYLAAHGMKVVGLDFSDVMIALAKERLPEGDFFVHDIAKPLALEKTFDGVFAQAVLLHVPKKEIVTVLRNITAPLKSGGYFYAAVKERRLDGPEEEVTRENRYGYEFERFFSYYTLGELAEYLSEVGLQFVSGSVTNAGKKNWVQIIARK